MPPGVSAVGGGEGQVCVCSSPLFLFPSREGAGKGLKGKELSLVSNSSCWRFSSCSHPKRDPESLS